MHRSKGNMLGEQEDKAVKWSSQYEKEGVEAENTRQIQIDIKVV